MVARRRATPLFALVAFIGSAGCGAAPAASADPACKEWIIARVRHALPMMQRDPQIVRVSPGCVCNQVIDGHHKSASLGEASLVHHGMTCCDTGQKPNVGCCSADECARAGASKARRQIPRLDLSVYLRNAADQNR